MPRIASTSNRGLTRIGLKRILSLPLSFYYPLTNTATDPTSATWRTNNAPAGYVFVPNDGIYSNEPITNMTSMFAGNATFNDSDIVLWDVSTVTNMNTAFVNCTAFNQPIGTWDVSNVTDMGGMFYGANATSFNQPIGGWDVSNVTNLNFFFGVPIDEPLDRSNMNLSGWSVPNITTEPQEWIPLGGDPVWGATQTPLIITYTDVSSASFYIFSTNDLLNDAVIDWGDGTKEVLTGSEFVGDPQSHSFPSTGTYTVTIRGYLPNFKGGLFGVGGGPLNPTNTGMTAVTEWNSTTVNLSGAFEAETALISVPNYLPLSVVNTRYMFDNAVKINDPNIALWDVSNVTDMDGMFIYAVSFNQDLSNWCVSNISSEPLEFSQGATSWTLPKPIWGTCPARWAYRDDLSKSRTVFGPTEVTGIASNGTVFCVVGGNGSCATSTDGVTWTVRNGLKDAGWNVQTGKIRWLENKFWVLSRSFSSAIASSPDGITWTIHTSEMQSAIGSSRQLFDIIKTSSQYYVVGSVSTVATSPDGITWTSQSGLGSTDWGFSTSVRSIVWNGSIFCAVGDNRRCATSTDGITWTNQTGISTLSGWSFGDNVEIAWNGTRFCVVNVFHGAATSTDGVTWSRNTQSPGSGTALQSSRTVISVGGTFVAGTSQGQVSTSTDGITWTNNTVSSTASEWSNSTVLALAKSQTTYCIGSNGGLLATSTNITSWTYQENLSQRSTVFGAQLISKIVWNGTRFCVGSGLFSGSIATSTDGATWTYQPGLRSTGWGTTPIDDIIVDGSTFWAGGNGKIASSPDGATWTYRGEMFGDGGWFDGSPGGYVILAKSPARFVAVGGQFRVGISTDGITWTSPSFTNSGPGLPYYYWVIWTGTRFVAGGGDVIGNSPVLATSDNGTSWTYRTTFTNNPNWTDPSLQSCAWNGSIMVVIGGDGGSGGGSGNVATSTDGINWTIGNPLPFGFNLKKIIFANGLFWAIGDSIVASSTDGLTWTSRPNGLTEMLSNAGNLSSIAVSNSTACITGGNGSVATLSL